MLKYFKDFFNEKAKTRGFQCSVFNEILQQRRHHTHIKLNVTTDVELTTGSFNPEHGLPFRVLDPHPRLAQAP